MIISQKMTKWCLFAAFFLFMPSIYVSIENGALFAPIHMVSLMLMGLMSASKNLGFSVGILIWTALHLAIYLALYYGLSVFLAHFLFKIPKKHTRQGLTFILLASIVVTGLMPDYGTAKRHRRLSDHPSWLQIFQEILPKSKSPRINMHVLPKRVVAPGTVTISAYPKSFPKGEKLYAWDLDEDGVPEIQKPHKHEVEHTYQQPGLYQPRVQVTDSEGTNYNATIEMLVLDRVELESQLNLQWKALWSVLGNRDEKTLIQYTTEDFRKKYRSGFWGNLFLVEKTADRYSAPLSIVENYQKGSNKLVLVLHSSLQSPKTTNQTPIEVRFEYDADPYDYDNSNPYRIFDYRELPEDYSLESHLSSQWSHMIQALEEGNIKEAMTYFAKGGQKYFKRSFYKYWMSEENPYLKQAHVLRVPLRLIKMGTGKLTLESALPQKESASSPKLRVEFVRKYENQKRNRISSIEILPNNEQFESDLNSIWIAMWDAARENNYFAWKYLQYPNRTNEFFYLSHTDKEFLKPLEWVKQKVDWAALAKQFQVPLKLVDRCDNRIRLIHVFPSTQGNQNQTYLEVNFSQNSRELWKFNPWKIDQYHLHSGSLPDSFANALKDKTKGKDFDLCVQNERFVTKDDPSFSNRIRRLLGFQ